MILLYIISMLIILGMTGTGIHLGKKSLSYKKTYGLPAAEVNALSWPSQQILKDYNSLPNENRPYPKIVNMLKALDVKHDVKRVDRHFEEDSYYRDNKPTTYDWKCCRRSYGDKDCISDYQEYHDLRNGIVKVKTALAEKEHAIQVASVEGNLRDVKELVQRFDEEEELLRKVTKETLAL
jgi:hypothetical protein